jgi:hypothetical protein
MRQAGSIFGDKNKDKEVVVALNGGGVMAVESSQLNSAGRDAYWQATQAELESAKQSGDILSLIGLGSIAALLWYYRDSGDNLAMWAGVVAAVALTAIAIPQIYVAHRRRRISAARGLNCRHCGYVPHHTEISEVVNTRECRRCEKPLA